ncbi:MAG: ATP-binding protein [Sulfitobacter sp.]
MSLANKLTEERRRRLAAERMLELKKAELFAANRKLGKHARQLNEKIVETRAAVEIMRGENKRVKSDLSAANQRLAVVERRILHSIDAIKDGFAFFNMNNEMVMANRAYLATFDGLEAIKGGVNYVTILQALTDEGIVNTGDLSPDAWRQMMTERFQKTRPEPIIIQLWDQKYYKLIDQRGPTGDMITLSLDISETVAYEEQLKEARSIAESGSRAKSAFLANMSHEIRTPMNGVIGMTDVLLTTEMDSEQRPYVETIKSSAEALLVIINDVLDYSKIEAEKLILKPKAFDLERAVREVLLLLQPSCQEKGILLLFDCDLLLPQQVVGDPGRLRQVLTNLIGNAVKFTTEGHVLVRVLGKPLEGEDKIQLAVTIEDTGIGIPENMVDHVFGEFNQVEDERNRQFEGTGLGLAISQRLVEMMDGEIWVTSTQSVGSCFGFDINVAIDEKSPAIEWQKPPGLSRVMIVDDIAVHRSILTRQFAQLKIDVAAIPMDEAKTVDLTDVDMLLVADTMGTLAISDLKTRMMDRPLVILNQVQHKMRSEVLDLIDGVLECPPKRHQLFELLAGQKFEEVAPSPKAVPRSNPSRKMRVLAAEDNKTNQLVLSKLIKELNIELTFANNGLEAVELFQSIKPDLIFMDISMPKMDGKEATANIRKLETNHRTPIVALTAHALQGDDDEILAAGLDRYLTKPLRKPLIVEQIELVHLPEFEPLYPDQAVA